MAIQPTIRRFKTDDGHALFFRHWSPSRPKAVLHLLHGMAEHSGRYQDFASYLAGRGYAVYAQDHRGHGYTATGNGEPYGFFAEKEGWARVAKDSEELDGLIEEEEPNIPLFLMGHSMGSFLARTVMADTPNLFFGVVIMGTGCSKGLVGKIGMHIAERHIRKYGPKAEDPKMDALSFAHYDDKIVDPRTKFDWLSHNEVSVDAYIADPRCGFICTASFYRDLLVGVEAANDKQRAQRLPKDLPLLIMSGAEDPVGDWGKGVQKVYELYKDAGLTDVTLNLVEGARHEVLNELDGKKNFKEIADWMDDRL